MDVDDIDSVMLVGSSSRIPKVQELLIEYIESEEKINMEVDPDEANAVGAAMMAGIITEAET